MDTAEEPPVKKVVETAPAKRDLGIVARGVGVDSMVMATTRHDHNPSPSRENENKNASHLQIKAIREAEIDQIGNGPPSRRPPDRGHET